MAGPTDESPADLLRDDILTGVFSPGERLTEVAMADRYAVGRGSVRAALVALRAEGLVDIEANRGALVRRISLDEAIEIAEARQVLEGLIAARAADAADASERDSLLAVLADMKRAVAANDHAAYSELNLVLHRRIWDIGGHGVANDLVSNLRDRSAHHQYRLAVMPGRSEESLAQHEAIVNAIVAGDGTEAERAMHHHLDSVIDALRHWSERGSATSNP